MKKLLEQLDAGHAVHHAVVRLADERELVVFDALHDPEFPERPAAIETLGKDPADHSFEHALVARKRKPRVPKMEVNVESVVVDPNRMVEAGHPFEPLAVPRDAIEGAQRVSTNAVDVETAVLERQGLRVEQERGADVHRDRLALEVEEDGVEGAQALVKRFRHDQRMTIRFPPPRFQHECASLPSPCVSRPTVRSGP